MGPPAGLKNLEFNAYFLDLALTEGVSVVECPVTLHPRVGSRLPLW